MSDLRKELMDMKYRLGFVERVNCSEEENEEYRKSVKEGKPLPYGVYAGEYVNYYRFEKVDLSEDEIRELLLYRQVSYIKTIKNCVLFFVVFTVISIIGSIIFSFAMSS